jgi:hypothetical protein
VNGSRRARRADEHPDGCEREPRRHVPADVVPARSEAAFGEDQGQRGKPDVTGELRVVEPDEGLQGQADREVCEERRDAYPAGEPYGEDRGQQDNGTDEQPEFDGVRHRLLPARNRWVRDGVRAASTR